MSKTYVILWMRPGTDDDRDSLAQYLMEKKTIETWEYCFRDTLFVKSSLSAQQIWKVVEEKISPGRSLVVSVGEQYWGRLPQNYWDIFK